MVINFSVIDQSWPIGYDRNYVMIKNRNKVRMFETCIVFTVGALITGVELDNMFTCCRAQEGNMTSCRVEG